MDDQVVPLKARDDGKLYAADITMAQYLAVLHRLTPADNNACPACGCTNWDVHHDGTLDDSEPKPVILASPSLRDEKLRQLYLFTSCSRCGYMRQYRAESIALLASNLS